LIINEEDRSNVLLFFTSPGILKSTSPRAALRVSLALSDPLVERTSLGDGGVSGGLIGLTKLGARGWFFSSTRGWYWEARGWFFSSARGWYCGTARG